MLRKLLDLRTLSIDFVRGRVNGCEGMGGITGRDVGRRRVDGTTRVCACNGIVAVDMSVRKKEGRKQKVLLAWVDIYYMCTFVRPRRESGSCQPNPITEFFTRNFETEVAYYRLLQPDTIWIPKIGVKMIAHVSGQLLLSQIRHSSHSVLTAVWEFLCFYSIFQTWK